MESIEDLINGKRVALFVPSLRGGGAERVMTNIANGLSRKGYVVDLILGVKEGPYLNQVDSQINIINFSKKKIIFTLFPLVRYLMKNKPMALLSTMDHVNLVAILAVKLARVNTRCIVRVATTVSKAKGYQVSFSGQMVIALIRRGYQYADRIVVPSEGVADDLYDNFRIPHEKMIVIYNPVISKSLFDEAAETVSHPWFMDGCVPVIVGVGRLSEPKDFGTLIRAFARVSKVHECRLLLLGEGEERESLEVLVSEMKLNDSVQMPGFVVNPFKYIKHSSVFVLSSIWEGLPGVLIQALALGVPVVSTDCPSGPREILMDGKIGQLVPVGDDTAMSESILTILSQRGRQSGKFKFPIDVYSIESSVDQYERLFC